MRNYSEQDQPFRNRAPALAPNTGIWLTASTTAKVMTSMAMPEIAAFVEVVNQHAEHLGLRREQDDGRGKLTHHADKDKTPCRDHAGAQQRRGDLAQRLQPRGAENAAGVLELGMDGGERRLQLLIGRRQVDGQERDQQDPQRAVQHERRPCVAEEQADAEHDPGNGNRRSGEKTGRARARDHAAGRDIGDDER